MFDKYNYIYGTKVHYHWVVTVMLYYEILFIFQAHHAHQILSLHLFLFVYCLYCNFVQTVWRYVKWPSRQSKKIWKMTGERTQYTGRSLRTSYYIANVDLHVTKIMCSPNPLSDYIYLLFLHDCQFDSQMKHTAIWYFCLLAKQMDWCPRVMSDFVSEIIECYVMRPFCFPYYAPVMLAWLCLGLPHERFLAMSLATSLATVR